MSRKSLILVLVVISVFLCCQLAERTEAQTTTVPQEKLGGLDKDEQEVLKSQLKGLAEVFGVEQSKQPGQPQAPATQKKTMADVTDKALDMVNKMVADAAITLQKVAPDVWRIMIKQQYAYAFSTLVAPWFSLLFVLGFMLTMIKKWKLDVNVQLAFKEKQSPEIYAKFWIAYAVPMIFIFIFGFWGISRIADSAALLINPEFYAIKNLILILLGKPTGV